MSGYSIRHTGSEITSPAHKRAEGRASVWGSEFTTKAATLQGGGVDRGAQAIVRCGARCVSQVLNRGAQVVAHGAARCASQEFDRGAQADARGAATLSQQEINNSADAQRNRVNITGSICKVAL